MGVVELELAGIDRLLAEAQAAIDRYTPAEAIAAAELGVPLIDIRPLEQRRRDGAVPGATAIDRNVLEWRLDPACEYRIPRLAQPGGEVILVCDEGFQSSLAAATLCGFGLRAGDVIGGAQEWLRQGLPLQPISSAS